MKRLLTILLTTQIFYSCGQHTNQVETILLDCLMESYQSEGVDIKKQLDEFESYLIENGSLASSSGQAYFDFYNKIVELNDLPAITNSEQFEELYKLHPDQYYSLNCLTRITELDSNEIKASKFNDLTLAMQNLKTRTNISPSIVAKEITSVLGPSDFDNPYYRSIALLTIANTGNVGTGILTKLPHSKNQEENLEEYASLTILLTASDEIFIGQTIVSQKELHSQLKNFILNNESKHLIHFTTEKGTSYDFYIKIQDFTKEIYSKVREMKSKALYGKSFDTLSDDEKKGIKKIYPFNLKEG